MDNENIENMEKQARINALKIALRQTDSQAIAHLESAVGAILQMMKPAQRASVLLALAEYEQLSPE
ncbi:MAG: hypothetical protein FWC70_10095, partial [Defluviitaleaceae bacterium]|nr:hypothetical protein [Defluviitaleaceae bacterium]